MTLTDFLKKLTFSVVLVMSIGFLQIVGFVTGIDGLRDVGRLTAASPLPLVFSDFRGLETFSLEFSIEAKARDGQSVIKKITPELYDKFRGPYNRRNVYGAVLAYGPKLTEPTEEPMVDSVLKYGFCKGGPLVSMFGLSDPLQMATITALSKARSDGGAYVTEVDCQ